MLRVSMFLMDHFDVNKCEFLKMVLGVFMSHSVHSGSLSEKELHFNHKLLTPLATGLRTQLMCVSQI